MSATPLATACRGCGSHLGLYIADSPYCVDCEDQMPEKPERPDDCPTCRGVQYVTLPVGPDVDDAPCPTCCPEAWSQGFPGLRGSGREWAIRPTGRFAGREA